MYVAMVILLSHSHNQHDTIRIRLIWLNINNRHVAVTLHNVGILTARAIG
jgi:hypothetical protein